MKLSVVRGGGFAGLVTTASVDSASLAPEHAEELRTRVEESGLFDLPPRVISDTDHPDRFDYAVTVENGNRRHTVLLSGEALPEGIRSLISWLDSVPGREERLQAPGGNTPTN